MSRENVEIVRQHLEAYAAGDAERALSFVHPEVEVDVTRVGGAEGAIWRGYEGLDQGVRNFRGAFADYLVEVRRVLDAHDSVVGLIREVGRGKASGIETERLTANVYLLKMGKIVRITQYPRDAEALEAVGLSEQPISQGNVEWVRAAHRAWNEGGPKALAENFWHPEIVWHEPPETPGAGVYRGRDEVLRYFTEFMDTMGKLRIDTEDVIAEDGSLTVAVLHLVGAGPASEVPVELSVTHVYRVDTDHRAVEVRAYLDPQQALAAVGLSE